MKYKLIWIDDQYTDQIGFITDAEQEEIELVPFKTSKDGMAELERNISLYDGVILDAKVYKDSENEVAKLDGLSASIHKIVALSSSRVIPYFIFSAHPDLLDSETFKAMLNGKATYLKNSDNECLFQDIKAEADGNIETQIRHKNMRVFEIFQKKYLSADVEKQVLDLIKADLPKSKNELKGFLTWIRSIHESCLIKLEEIKVIPDAEASFNVIIRQLSGNKSQASGFAPTTKEYQNDAIENLNKWLYFTCGKYIHNLKDENYKDYMISNYAAESLRSGLLELLLWFKQTVELNSK
jgi:hypothetical protein